MVSGRRCLHHCLPQVAVRVPSVCGALDVPPEIRNSSLRFLLHSRFIAFLCILSHITPKFTHSFEFFLAVSVLTSVQCKIWGCREIFIQIHFISILSNDQSTIFRKKALQVWKGKYQSSWYRMYKPSNRLINFREKPWKTLIALCLPRWRACRRNWRRWKGWFGKRATRSRCKKSRPRFSRNCRTMRVCYIQYCA